MRRYWFVTNAGSGSTSLAGATALEEAFREAGFERAGLTDFPGDPLPRPEQLDEAQVDIAALYAGDGTINAAITALEGWRGAILILPGGTMNLLSKALHGDLAPAAILAAVEGARKVALPFVEADGKRGYVGLIAGPAAIWVHAREKVRARRARGLWRAVAAAWRHTFDRRIRVQGAPGLPRDAQAVFVRPDGDQLDVAAVSARDWRSIAELGWQTLTGDWVAARAVTHRTTQRLTIAERKPVMALFDGEPHQLPPGAAIEPGRTAPVFLATLEAQP